MTPDYQKVYSVRSNARRDCRKFGIDPEMVVPVDGGFQIYRSKPVRAPVSAGTKRQQLLDMLRDWSPLPDLMSATGWQAHTVRGALSTAAKAIGIEIERRRDGGVTSYRIRP